MNRRDTVFTPPWERAPSIRPRRARYTPVTTGSFLTRPLWSMWVRQPWTRPSWSLDRPPIPPLPRSLVPIAPDEPLNGRQISCVVRHWNGALPIQMRGECWLSGILNFSRIMSRMLYSLDLEILGQNLLYGFEAKLTEVELQQMSPETRSERGHGGLKIPLSCPLEHIRDYGFLIAHHKWRYFPIQDIIVHDRWVGDRDFIRSRLDDVGALLVSFWVDFTFGLEDQIGYEGVVDMTGSDAQSSRFTHTAILCGYEVDNDVWIVRNASTNLGVNGVLRMKLLLSSLVEVKWAPAKAHTLFRAPNFDLAEVEYPMGPQ